MITPISIQITQLVISVLTLITTFTLTICTILSNKKLHKEQQDLQRNIAATNTKNQLNSIIIANRTYCEKVYETIIDIYSITDLLTSMESCIKQKNFNECKEIFEVIFAQHPNIENETQHLYIGAEYVSYKLKPAILQIRTSFKKIIDLVSLFKIGSIILTDEEIKNEYKTMIKNIFTEVLIIEKTKNLLDEEKETIFSIKTD